MRYGIESSRRQNYFDLWLFLTFKTEIRLMFGQLMSMNSTACFDFTMKNTIHFAQLPLTVKLPVFEILWFSTQFQFQHFLQHEFILVIFYSSKLRGILICHWSLDKYVTKQPFLNRWLNQVWHQQLSVTATVICQTVVSVLVKILTSWLFS